MAFETISWRNGRLFILDQTLLPLECREVPLDTVEAVWEAIRKLRVRGAPAIGVCAAYGIIVGLNQRPPTTVEEAIRAVHESAEYLATSRPTAVNLFWALDRMRNVADSLSSCGSVQAIRERLEAAAIEIQQDDLRRCRAIGDHGAALIRDGDGILTHCNAGGLATAGYGTALAVLYRARELGRRFHVFADETRPLLQGARLTAWELQQHGIEVTVICDSAAAQVMREGRVQRVIVGADRIAANGDTANKIGTYGLAVLAEAHRIPFYVAAPLSTFDPEIESGDEIPIEQRDPEEIVLGLGRRTAPEGIAAYNPAFDVTPSRLITGIVTERGIIGAPYRERIAALLGEHASTF